MKKDDAVERVAKIITNLEGIATSRVIAREIIKELEDMGMTPSEINRPSLELDVNLVREWEDA